MNDTVDLQQLPYIAKEQLRIIFISNYFDLPITGLAILKPKTGSIETTNQPQHIIRFDYEDTFGEDTPTYRIEQLSPEELAYELAGKAAFEHAVGYHWSFDPHTGKPLQKCFINKNPELTEAYYTQQQEEKKPIFPKPIIIGWTDQVR